MKHKFRRIHFVGIAGVGMCGLAELLRRWGYEVSGSDLRSSTSLEQLSALGVEIEVGHAPEHVARADIVVYSTAIAADNPELVAANQRGIPLVHRGEMLAEVMREKRGIAVSGTHGKTTTTALIAHILARCDLDPIALIGGRVEIAEDLTGGAILGDGDWFIAEADESDGSFLKLNPCIAVITNIDAEHLEHYGDFAALESAFAEFAGRVPFWGAAVVCWDHPVVRKLAAHVPRNLVRYGTHSGADLVAGDIRYEGDRTHFSVKLHGTPLGTVELPMLGEHNVANALAALAVALEVGIPFSNAARALASFTGVERRFEEKGNARGVRVVDDYGHHPVEVRATLDAARRAHPGRLVTVFQPHRFTRTRDCLDEFANAFESADIVVICDTYAAGENPIEGAEAKQLADAVRKSGHPDVRFVDTLDRVAELLPSDLEPGDLVITMGAGDITQLGSKLLTALALEPTP